MSAGIQPRRLVIAIMTLPGLGVLGIWLLAPAVYLFAKSFTANVGFLQTEARISLSSYVQAMTGDLYRDAAINSLVVGGLAAVICTAAAYPAAFFLSFVASRRRRDLLLFGIVVSSFTSHLVRVYAWRTILGRNGVVNWTLERAGIVDAPISWLLFSRWAVLVGLVSAYLPIAILIVAVSMQNVRYEVIESARDLGAGSLRAFAKIILPLTSAGATGCLVFTFILAASDYIVPELLGGDKTPTIAGVIADQFLQIGNFPLGAALSFLLLLTFAVVFLVVSHLPTVGVSRR
jgi:spermidine/putrescine transport system permease protein